MSGSTRSYRNCFKDTRRYFVEAVSYLLHISKGLFIFIHPPTTNLYITYMTDASDFIKVLQDWKDQTGKTITNVLKRVSEIRQFKPNEIDDVLKAVVDFHREIGRAD